MTIEYRVTIRLTAEVYAQLEARGSHGQPLAAIVRDALEQYLARPPEQPPIADTAAVLAAMAASSEMLQGRVDHLTARVDTFAAAWQPVTATDSARQPAGSHGRGSDSHRQPRLPSPHHSRLRRRSWGPTTPSRRRHGSRRYAPRHELREDCGRPHGGRNSHAAWAAVAA
jgi:hypothetical protein